MAQNGFLIKVAKGIYRYDPDHVEKRELEDFTEAQKEAIKKRDGYKCVICGLGPANGVEIQVDHIRPKDLGGKAEIDNGQTLCAKHNFRKKNYGQTEMSKKMFVNMYNSAKRMRSKRKPKNNYRVKTAIFNINYMRKERICAPFFDN